MRILYFLFVLIAFSSCSDNASAPKEQVTNTPWQLGPFVKADEANPILVPDSSQTFFCPIRQQQIKWEEKDVFNPATVVRNDTVFLLYRAQACWCR